MEQKRAKVAALKKAYEQANQEFDQEVLAPGRVAKAAQERAAAEAEAARNVRQGKMQAVLAELRVDHE